MKRILLLIIVLTIGVRLSAQNGNLFGFGLDAMEKPNVTAWEMMKYGKHQPVLNTGSMSYSQPLYTYKDEDFVIYA